MPFIDYLWLHCCYSCRLERLQKTVQPSTLLNSRNPLNWIRTLDAFGETLKNREMNCYYNTTFIVWECRLEVGYFKSSLGDSYVVILENHISSIRRWETICTSRSEELKIFAPLYNSWFLLLALTQGFLIFAFQPSSHLFLSLMFVCLLLTCFPTPVKKRKVDWEVLLVVVIPHWNFYEHGMALLGELGSVVNSEWIGKKSLLPLTTKQHSIQLFFKVKPKNLFFVCLFFPKNLFLWTLFCLTHSLTCWNGPIQFP